MIILAYIVADKFHGLRPGDALRLTHINFSFAIVKDGRASIDHWKNSEEIRTFLKRRGHIKVSLSVGGLGAEGFSPAVADAESREVFAQSLIDIMDDFGFNGIDLDWEYPDDRVRYTALVRLLREKMGSKKLLSMAAGALESCVNDLELDKLSELIDFFGIMTYDMMNLSVASHHTSLYASDISPSMYSDKAIRLYHEAGVPKEKLLLGSGFYARVFKDVDGINCPTDGIPSGYLSGGYAGILDFIKKAGGFSYDEQAQAPYAYDTLEKTFITFDNLRSLNAKIDYVKREGLAGIMFWEYGSDDGDSTLLKAIAKASQHNAEHLVMTHTL